MSSRVLDHTTASRNERPMDAQSIFLPIGRPRALTRALLRLAPASAMVTVSWSVLTNLTFARGGASSPIVDVAWALVLIPFVFCTAALGVSGFRWLALACWPRPTGIRADATGLTLALGPFGTRRYDAERLTVHYPFERTEDEEADTFEALLPQDEQIHSFLPTMRHPAAREPLNRVVMRFAIGTEPTMAQALRPMLARWRGEDDTARPDK